MTNKQPLEKFNELDYLSHPEINWLHRIFLFYFFIAGSLLSIAVIFFIVNTESGRAFASNPMLREFILSTFPDAQLWVNTTLKYKQEIVFIYFYYVLLLLWAGSIVVYLFIFNWRKMRLFIRLIFAKNQGKDIQLCTFKKMFKLIVATSLLMGVVVGFGLMFEPSLTPLAYDDYHHNTSARGLGQYEVWNSYFGLTAMFVVKVHATFVLLLFISLLPIMMLMCFKKNAFYSPK